MAFEMLSQEDIDFMHATRQEIIHNRRREVVITYRGAETVNPITGVTEYATGQKTVLSVVTDRTSRVAAERRLKEQAEIIQGDLWFSISIDQLTDINPKSIVQVLHNGDVYEVVSEDPKGIGEYNRHEFVGKKVV